MTTLDTNDVAVTVSHLWQLVAKHGGTGAISAEQAIEQYCHLLRDRADLQERLETLEEAAQAVIDRWETPLWKDVPATAEYIARLRAALSA